MAGSQRSWVIQQCENLRTHVINRGLATALEVEKVWPGEDGEEADLDRAWIKCYGWLRAWRYVESIGEGGKEEAQRKVTEILRDEPKEVSLTTGQRVSVYPKSFHALLWFRERDWLLGYLTSYLADLKAARASGDLPKSIFNPDRLVDQIVEEIEKQLADIASVATSEGPKLPEEIVPIDDLSPIDFVFIHQAFVEVNTVRLASLDRIVRPQGGRGETGWNVFYGTMSQKLGKSAAYLMKNESMASLVASARLAAPDLEDSLAGN